MKEIILNYLKTDRSYNAGVRLFMQYGQSMGFKQTLNRQMFTEYLHRVLLEQLCELAGISIEELNDIVARPVQQPEAIAPVPAAEDKGNQDPPEDYKGNPDPPAGEKGAALTEEEKAKQIVEIPENVRKAIRLRDEFPFLASPECPTEFKVLVHDMLTAYTTYVDLHPKLFEVTTIEDLQKVAQGVVENYIENHAIWDELNHYKATGEILGKHPIFAKNDRMAEIQAMTTAEQVKLQKNLMNNLARTKKNIADKPDHKNTAERKASIAQWEIELEEVNRILGLDAKTV